MTTVSPCRSPEHMLISIQGERSPSHPSSITLESHRQWHEQDNLLGHGSSAPSGELQVESLCKGGVPLLASSVEVLSRLEHHHPGTLHGYFRVSVPCYPQCMGDLEVAQKMQTGCAGASQVRNKQEAKIKAHTYFLGNQEKNSDLLVFACSRTVIAHMEILRSLGLESSTCNDF